MLERGIPIKEGDTQPLIGGLEWYATAFFELSTCRTGLSDGPIPFTAIVEFANIYRVDDFEDFNYIIRQMDNAYLDFKDKNGSGKTSTDNKGSN